MWEMLVLFLLRGLFDLKHNQQQIEFSSAWAASRLPRGIQRAESLRELKLCQEEQTGGKPRPLPLQWGNHSLLNVDVVYWVTSILVAWLVEHGHADLSRGSWISMMLQALIHFVSQGWNAGLQNDWIYLSGVIRGNSSDSVNILASGHYWQALGVCLLRCDVGCRGRNVMAGRSQIFRLKHKTYVSPAVGVQIKGTPYLCSHF